MAEFKLDEEYVREFYTKLKEIRASLEEGTSASLPSIFSESKGAMMDGISDFMNELEIIKDTVFETLEHTQSYLEEVTEVVVNEDSSIAQELE